MSSVIFDNMPDSGNRIKFIIYKFFGGSAKAFCDETGINRASLSLVVNNKRKISEPMIEQITKAVPEVPLFWLTTGVSQNVDAEAEKDKMIKSLQEQLADANANIKRLEKIIDIFLQDK